MDPNLAWGHRFYMKNAFFPAITSELADLCAARVCDAPGNCSVSFLAQGGAIARVTEEATAFAGRSAAFWCGVETIWDEPALDDAHIGWGRATMAALKPFSGGGHYVNDVIEAGQGVARAIYGDAKYERLAALKRVWDPTTYSGSTTTSAPDRLPDPAGPGAAHRLRRRSPPTSWLGRWPRYPGLVMVGQRSPVVG